MSDMKWLQLLKLPKYVFGRRSCHSSTNDEGSIKMAVLGPPGSGTHNYAKLIQSTFNIVQVSVPQLIITNVSKGGKMKELVEVYTIRNRKIPDHKMVDFVTEKVKKLGNDSWVMNGFPTSLEQAGMFWDNFKLDLVLHIILPKEIIVRNLLKRYSASSNTTDDQKQRNVDDIMAVLDAYVEGAPGMFDFYDDRNVLRSIYSNSSEGAWKKIERHVKKAINK